jgi:hypothetical protein
VAVLNTNKSVIPKNTGCYVFTVGLIEVAPGRALYVGEAAGQTLRKRLGVYLINYQKPRIRKDDAPKARKTHKGKGFGVPRILWRPYNR